MGVQVAATPRLLHDVIVQNLAARGIDVSESAEPVVSVVTSDQTETAHSKIVIVLGDSAIGDVQILIEGEPSQRRHIEADHLHTLVLDLAEHLSHEQAAICAPRTPAETDTDIGRQL